MKNLSLAVLCLLTVAACVPPIAQDSAEIRAGSASWAEALNAGDLDTLVSLYAADARILPPNAPAGQGHDAVRESFGAMIEAGLGGTLSTIEAVAVGDIGHHVGTYEIHAGGEVVDRGKYVEIWRQEGGQWKIAADIWNSDLPAATAGGTTTLIGTHEVKDPTRWLAAWSGPDGRRADFMAHGGSGVRVFQSPADPKRVALLIEVADVNALTSWIDSEEGAAAKKADGVVEATLRILTEVE